MKRTALLGTALVLSACGSSPPPEPAPPPAPTTNAIESKPPPVEAKPAEPTAEEKKKAEALKELEADRAKLRADTETEKARWTPEMRAEAKALTDKAFPNGKAAIQAAMSAKFRKPANAARDKYRHPAETLDFFGFKPNMTVLEYGPGEGWYTELLAPALAKKGKLIATTADPNGPPESRATFYAERWKSLLDTSPELYGKVESTVVTGPKLNVPEGSVDMVLVTRHLHNMVNGKSLDQWLATIHSALKPNGVLGIEEHRAKADADPEESAKKGYVPEKWAIQKIEAAGFKLAGKSEINANPKDTKDYAEGVWTLPPTLKNGDKDKEKYMAIGESDRMTLKFVKVAAKPAAAEPKGDKPAGDKPAGDKPGAKPATPAPKK
jgi:predicted methyltransferase